MSEHDYFEAWWKKQELGDKANYEADRAFRTVALSAWLARSALTPLPEGREQERDAIIEECAKVCVQWGDDKVRKWQGTELDTDAKSRAWDGLMCAAAIRALKRHAPQPQRQNEK